MDRKLGGLIVAMSLALSGCTSYQVVPTTNAAPGSRSGQVDILYSTPQRPYESIGTVSAKKYKPGWSDPTVSDALDQLRAAGRAVNADGVIVRSSSGQNGRRMITVEGEAIRYTDVAAAGTPASFPNASAAKGFASGRGCGVPSLLSDSSGVALYQAKCPSGATLIIECRAESCNARN